MSEVISIECIGTCGEDEYVYDLETEDGTFQAGEGNIILKNTDSIYTIFNGIDMEKEGSMQKVFDLSIEAADMISKTFPPPMELEFEKVMFPFILCSKKRYAALIWTNVDKPDYVDIKGLQPVRRDNCPFVRETATKCFDEVLYKRSIEGAVDVAKGAISDLINGNVPTSKLTKSKSLRDSYSISKVSDEDKLDLKIYRANKWEEKMCEGRFKLQGENVVGRWLEKGKRLLRDEGGQFIYASVPTMPHLHLTKKLFIRDKMNAPKAGDRVPFVYIKGIGLQCKRVEDPVYFDTTGDSEIDILHYLYNELQNPLNSIFTHLIDDVSILYNDPKIKKLEKQQRIFEIKEKNKKNNQADMMKFFKPKGK